MSLHDSVVLATARKEIDEELFRARVDAEKAKLYAHRNKSPWSRFLAWLPFTITWK